MIYMVILFLIILSFAGGCWFGALFIDHGIRVYYFHDRYPFYRRVFYIVNYPILFYLWARKNNDWDIRNFHKNWKILYQG